MLSVSVAAPLFPHADVNETYTLYRPPVWNGHETIRGTERTNNSRGLEQRGGWSRGTSAPVRVPPRGRTATGRGAC